MEPTRLLLSQPRFQQRGAGYHLLMGTETKPHGHPSTTVVGALVISMRQRKKLWEQEVECLAQVHVAGKGRT